MQVIPVCVAGCTVHFRTCLDHVLLLGVGADSITLFHASHGLACRVRHTHIDLHLRTQSRGHVLDTASACQCCVSVLQSCPPHVRARCIGTWSSHMQIVHMHLV